MRTSVLALAIGLCAATGLAQTTRPAATHPASEDALAAESLRRSALSMIHSPSGTPGRAARLVALTRFAEALVPSDPQTAWLLTYIYGTQGKGKLAADAARTYLAAYPDDHVQWVQWLNFSLGAMEEDADKRLAFLRGVAEDKKYPIPVRAEAAALTGPILLGQGEKAKAAAAMEEALRLDAYNPAALRGRFNLIESPTPVQRADLLLNLLKANPQDEEAAWQLALLSGSLGSYKEAPDFFGHAWEFVSRRAPRDTQANFAAQHMSAMLDAGLAAQAVEKFQPMLTRYSDSTDLRSLLAEAWDLTGQQRNAQELLKDMRLSYQRKETAGPSTPALASELAWFYLVSIPNADDALNYAKQAERVSGDSPVVQRILGAAELGSGKSELVEAGLARLKKLLNSDVYAAVFLTEHYYASGKKVEGEKAILAGGAVSQSGPAFRRLAAMARRQGVKIPPMPGGAEVTKAVNAFDTRYLGMGTTPEKSLEVSMKPLRDRVLPGEAIEIEATLTNIGPLDVSLGDGGLLSPVMSLQATIAEYPKVSFTELPMVVWPAPRYLTMTRSIQCKVRLDVARLGDFLAAHPLEELTLKVDGLLAPVQRATAAQSSAPTIRVEPARIVRADLLGEFDRLKAEDWPKAYQLALGYVVRDMKRGDLPQRLRAAAQVGGLLAHAREIEMGRTDPPKPLRGQVTKPVLLTMMREVLKDSSPAVRAEMLASLNAVRLDDSILSLLATVVGDASPLVRFRMAELIGASDTSGQDALLDHFARDADELVRLMASAFRAEAKGGKE